MLSRQRKQEERKKGELKGGVGNLEGVSEQAVGYLGL